MNLDDFKAARHSSRADELAEYATSSSPAVRLAVAENPSTSADTLHVLARAPEFDVRMAALSRLPAGDAEQIESVREGSLGVAVEPAPAHLTMPMTTLAAVPGKKITETRGLIFGSSSRIAWGFSKQSDRLSNATFAALLDLQATAAGLGATSVVGVVFGLNSSTGSNMNILGSSEGVLVMGTAVVDVDT